MKNHQLPTILTLSVLWGSIISCASPTINTSALGEKEEVVYEICLPSSQNDQEQILFLQEFHLTSYNKVGFIAGGFKPTYLTKSGEIIYYRGVDNPTAIVAHTINDKNIRFIFNFNRNIKYKKEEWSSWQFPDAITTDENYDQNIFLNKKSSSNANSKLQPSIRYKVMKFNDYLKISRKYGQPHLVSEVESCPKNP